MFMPRKLEVSVDILAVFALKLLRVGEFEEVFIQFGEREKVLAY